MWLAGRRRSKSSAELRLQNPFSIFLCTSNNKTNRVESVSFMKVCEFMLSHKPKFSLISLSISFSATNHGGSEQLAAKHSHSTLSFDFSPFLFHLVLRRVVVGWLIGGQVVLLQQKWPICGDEGNVKCRNSRRDRGLIVVRTRCGGKSDEKIYARCCNIYRYLLSVRVDS